MNDWQLIVYGSTVLVMATISGISGGGGGFLITPVAILLGLSPAQAISSGKFNGLSVTLGSLAGLRKYKSSVSRYRIAAIMALAFVIGLIVPYVIKSFQSKWYQLSLGIILLLMIPIMLRKKMGMKPYSPSPKRRILGSILLSISLFLQGAFSGGLGSLVNVVLMGMMGMTANEAHITKRWSQLILNTTIIVGLLGSGLIVWTVVIVGVCTSLAGGLIGSHLAVKKGDKLAVNVLTAMMGVAALVLIMDAL